MLWDGSPAGVAETAYRSASDQGEQTQYTEPGDMSSNNAEVFAWKDREPDLHVERLVENSQITIASFVERKFLTEHIAGKRSAGKAYYQSMLRHILGPEEVDRILCKKPVQDRRLLKAIPGWPYLGKVRLCDTGPEDVSRLTTAALAHGYSFETVVHIRNVVHAIFAHAQRAGCFWGTNPVSLVKLPERPLRQEPVLTVSKAKDALGIMQYPEKEMMLIAVFTGMNLAEIAGLQWRRINLTMQEVGRNGVQIPPRAIAVRSHWLRGKMEPVSEKRLRDIPIALPLFQILVELKSRSKFNGENDFVLASKVGTPIIQSNILRRQLRTIAEKMDTPSLSFQDFSKIREGLASTLEMQYEEPRLNAVVAAPAQGTASQQRWNCLGHRRRIFPAGESAFRSSINDELATR